MRRTLVLLAALTVVACADRFEVGKKAYEQENYAVALQEWQPLANEGHADAQSWLGFLYSEGNGVLWTEYPGG